MLAGLGLDGEAFQVSSLIELLPRILRPRRTSEGLSQPSLVDGTHLMPSVFFWNEARRLSNVGAGGGAASNGGVLNIGRFEHALVRSEVGAVSIEKAPWPPVYVLEHAVMDTGLVVVNSVNCGYLDMAVNFLLAAREVVCDAKVCQSRHPRRRASPCKPDPRSAHRRAFVACMILWYTPRWCCLCGVFLVGLISLRLEGRPTMTSRRWIVHCSMTLPPSQPIWNVESGIRNPIFIPRC